MHIVIAIISAWCVVMRRDYIYWREFLPTMQYIAIGNLTYNFLCANHLLWKLNPDFLISHSLTEMLYTFITFPATVLMFLSHYPDQGSVRRKFWHIVCWVFIYVSVEVLLVLRGNILYNYGWSLGWSAAFDCLMFPMLRLHQKRPLLTYILSVPITIFWVWLFEVPVWIPIEDR